MVLAVLGVYYPIGHHRLWQLVLLHCDEVDLNTLGF
jgi:hypothetical protein